VSRVSHPVPSGGSSRELAERYDREAAAYAELWAPVLRSASSRFLPRLAGDPVRRVLDVGAGVGSLFPDLSSAFPRAHILGVDRSIGMLTLAPGGFDLATMDAGQLAIRDRSVDRVLMLFMLFHLPSPATGLAEARRVLKPGGLVGTITWGGELESPATRLWTECLDSAGAAPLDPATLARHERMDTPEKLDALLAQAGFERRECWTDDLACRIEAKHLLRLRTSMGATKPRFDSLEPVAQAACVSEARHRMGRLPADAFVARATLVKAVARA
jgi:ubiquinone/menaquinone biosynthesis C-methylase UbiE